MTTNINTKHAERKKKLPQMHKKMRQKKSPPQETKATRVSHSLVAGNIHYCPPSLTHMQSPEQLIISDGPPVRPYWPRLQHQPRDPPKIAGEAAFAQERKIVLGRSEDRSRPWPGCDKSRTDLAQVHRGAQTLGFARRREPHRCRLAVQVTRLSTEAPASNKHSAQIASNAQLRCCTSQSKEGTKKRTCLCEATRPV